MIEKGSRVRITLPNGQWGEGLVLTATNWNGGNTRPDNWYIELEKDKGNSGTGYGYWKQGPDGGTVELLASTELVFQRIEAHALLESELDKVVVWLEFHGGMIRIAVNEAAVAINCAKAITIDDDLHINLR